MKTKKPATHTGTITSSHPGKAGRTTETAELVEHAATWEDKATGQKYSKKSGCVRPCNMWDTRMLELETIKPING